jgi:hypothetical protein
LDEMLKIRTSAYTHSVKTTGQISTYTCWHITSHPLSSETFHTSEYGRGPSESGTKYSLSLTH